MKTTIIGVLPEHLARRMSISFWLWNYFYGIKEGEYFHDLEKCFVELQERGFNTIRVDSGAGLCHMRNSIHPRIRLPIFMLVISGWVTVTDLSMAAFAPDAYKQMGLYIQLIVAFASILARAEMFASKITFVPSMFDGIGMGLGFLFALSIISFFRELLGKGSLWGFSIIHAKPLLIMILPAGGFFAVGLLMGFFNYLSMRNAK